MYIPIFDVFEPLPSKLFGGTLCRGNPVSSSLCMLPTLFSTLNSVSSSREKTALWGKKIYVKLGGIYIKRCALNG